MRTRGAVGNPTGLGLYTIDLIRELDRLRTERMSRFLDEALGAA